VLLISSSSGDVTHTTTRAKVNKHLLMIVFNSVINFLELENEKDIKIKRWMILLITNTRPPKHDWRISATESTDRETEVTRMKPGE
jgi:hypothetical protein